MTVRALFLLMAWLVAPAHAAPKIAVLEAIGPPNTPAPYLMSWTDAVRGVVLDRAPPGHVVLTRSNIEAFLPPGLDLADCEGECEITTARKIGAELVVGIRVTAQGASRWVTIGLHAAIDGRLLGQGRVLVPVAQLETGLRDAAERALAAWRPVIGPTNAEAIVDAPVKAYTWLGAAVVRVESEETISIAVDGRAIGHTPLNVLLDGRTEIVLRASAPGRRSTRFRVRTGGASGRVKLALPSAQTTVTLDLPFDDLEVYIDGGRSVRGRVFLLDGGLHRLQVAHRCVDSAPFDVHVAPGGEQRVDMPLAWKCGNIRFESAIAKAEVRWAGRWHRLPFETPLATADDLPTQDTCDLRAPGHVARTIEVERSTVGTHTQAVSLEPDWVPVDLSVTRWNGERCDQPIRVDGRVVGKSRWRGRLLAGKHVVTGGCDSAVEARIKVQGPHQRVELAERGAVGEVALRLTGLDAALVAVRGWTGPHRAWRPRLGGGLYLGAIDGGPRWAPAVGAEVAVALPITDWLEVAAFGGIAVLSSDCPAESSRSACGIDSLDARGVVRFHWRSALLEGGWSRTWREVPGAESVSSDHPFMGVGLSF
ncbi:MAG: hypothetical protein ACI9U2_001187 [Bradymonadia bacterium]|jgi:hypothetical protein